MSTPVFRRTRVIAPEHIDELGHVNNVVWLRLVIDLAVDHCVSVGLSGESQRSYGGVWVVRRHELDYFRPAVTGDELTEETWISAMRGAQSVRRTRFLRGTDEVVCAVTQWVWVELASMRPKRIPPQIMAALPVSNAL